MKLNWIIVLLGLSAFVARADTLGLRFDKDYYFQDYSENTIEINVENYSGKLAFAEVEIYNSKIEQNNVVFELDKKVATFDVQPNNIAVPAGQTRKIKLHRDLSAPVNSKVEEYYRIRVIPKDPDDALKANPMLWGVLSQEERDTINNDKSTTTGALKMNLGSGSVITVQNKKAVKDGMIDANFNASAKEITLTNNNEVTVLLDNIKISSGSNSVSLGGSIIRGNQHKKLKIGDEDIRRLNFISNKVDKLIYTDQYGKEKEIILK